MNFLKSEFYARDTAEVAKDLLGKVLVRRVEAGTARCRIVETEAYFGENDPASHAARGRTKRNSVMFGAPGRAYVYFNYGMHHLFNVVTEIEGKAGAVLIRAVEPLDGVDAIMAGRAVKDVRALTNGPAKLTKVLGIDLNHNGRLLDCEDLGIIEEGKSLIGVKIAAGPRIGISAGQDLDLRFCLSGNEYLSRRPTKRESI